MVIESVDIFKGLDYRNFLNPARLYEFSSFPALLYKAVDLFWITAEILMVLLRFRFFYLFELMHPCRQERHGHWAPWIDGWRCRRH